MATRTMFAGIAVSKHERPRKFALVRKRPRNNEREKLVTVLPVKGYEEVWKLLDTLSLFIDLAEIPEELFRAGFEAARQLRQPDDEREFLLDQKKPCFMLIKYSGKRKVEEVVSLTGDPRELYDSAYDELVYICLVNPRGGPLNEKIWASLANLNDLLGPHHIVSEWAKSSSCRPTCGAGATSGSCASLPSAFFIRQLLAAFFILLDK